MIKNALNFLLCIAYSQFLCSWPSLSISSRKIKISPKPVTRIRHPTQHPARLPIRSVFRFRTKKKKGNHEYPRNVRSGMSETRSPLSVLRLVLSGECSGFMCTVQQNVNSCAREDRATGLRTCSYAHVSLHFVHLGRGSDRWLSPLRR